MPRVLSYREIGPALERMEEFTGNSMSARWSGGTYDVLSYRTVIAVYDPETGESRVTDNHWGKTTGRHIGMCRRHLPRIRSNAPEALDGIGPGCRVSYDRPGRVVDPPAEAEAIRSPRIVYGYVREVYPISGRVVIQPEYGYGVDREVLPREAVTLS